MDENNVVLIFGQREGSGYQIAPTLVLTANHVVANTQEVKVSRIHSLKMDLPRVTATVAWRDSKADIALLATPLQDVKRVEFGRGNGLISVAAMGFPDASFDVENRERDAFVVHGRCDTRTAALRNKLIVDVTSPLPRKLEAWKGFSGAILFSGDHLIGVVTNVPTTLQDGTLTATAVDALLATGAAKLLADAGLPPIYSDVSSAIAKSEAYSSALISSFRLDGAGLVPQVANSHALALGSAYSGTRFEDRTSPSTLAISDLIAATRPRIILSGEPGSGKSVALRQWLALAVERERIPVLIRLSSLLTALDEKQAPVPTFVRAFAREAAALGVPTADENFFEQLLYQGSLAIGLDGLDEAGERDERESVTQAIGTLADSHPGNLILVTSRPLELQTTPLPRSTRDKLLDFKEFAVLPFDAKQAKAFLRKCFDDADGALWARIGSDQHTRELARTPLLLTLLALLGREAPLPASQFDVHAAVVGTAVDTWNRRRRQKGERASGGAEVQQGHRLLERLALAMMQRQSPTAPISREDAIKETGAAETEALDWLIRNSGILLALEKRGAKFTRSFIQFAHFQIQEHLAGCGLARQFAEAPEQAWKVANESRAIDYWHQAHVAAAATLARAGQSDVIEKWVTSLLASGAVGDGFSGEECAVRAAWILGQAEPEELPADELVSQIMSGLAGMGGLRSETKIDALGALLPRAEALAMVHSIALQNDAGSEWTSSNVYSGESTTYACYAVASCARWTCEYLPNHAKAVLELAREHAAKTANRLPWVALAHPMESESGRQVAEDFLSSLVSAQGEHATYPSELAALFDRLDEVGYLALARRLAIQGSKATASDVATNACAWWLEQCGDEEAIQATDAYYSRLADFLAAGVTTSIRHTSLELWPSRISDATRKLHLAVLANSDTAWRALLQRDSHYEVELVASARNFFAHEQDRSRVRSVVHSLCSGTATPTTTQILLDALTSYVVALWAGTLAVERLVSLGQGLEVRDVLTRIRALPSTEEPHQRAIDSLLSMPGVTAQPDFAESLPGRESRVLR